MRVFIVFALAGCTSPPHPTNVAPPSASVATVSSSAPSEVVVEVSVFNPDGSHMADTLASKALTACVKRRGFALFKVTAEETKEFYRPKTIATVDRDGLDEGEVACLSRALRTTSFYVDITFERPGSDWYAVYVKAR